MLANVLFPFIHNYVTNKIHVSFYFFSYSLLKKNKNPLTHESGKSLCSRVQENAILHKDSANTMHNYNVYLNVKAEVCTHICVCVPWVGGNVNLPVLDLFHGLAGCGLPGKYRWESYQRSIRKSVINTGLLFITHKGWRPPYTSRLYTGRERESD